VAIWQAILTSAVCAAVVTIVLSRAAMNAYFKLIDHHVNSVCEMAKKCMKDFMVSHKE